MTRYGAAADAESPGLGFDIEANVVEANGDGYPFPHRISQDEEADESTSLLQNNDLPADIAPSKGFRRLVVGMCVLFLFIIEVSQYILNPPMEQIMEDVICRHYHPDHMIAMPQLRDNRCKDTEIQKTLAMVRSWSTSLDMLLRKCPVLKIQKSSSRRC
jgi:hypothetical protein